MDYEIAENEIVTRINEQIALNGVSNLYMADLMPETLAEFKTLYAKINKARAAVQFIDSKPLPSNNLGLITQEEIVKFRLSFDAKRLRGPGGLYAMQRLVKLVLIGWKLTDAITPLTYVAYDMLQVEQNSFQPYLEFECKFVNVQQSPGESFNKQLSDLPITVKFPPELFE